jgi:hypothetical protein
MSRVRIVEKRGRGALIKKFSDLQHLLDHQMELHGEIRLGVGLLDCNKTVDLWFVVSPHEAGS